MIRFAALLTVVGLVATHPAPIPAFGQPAPGAGADSGRAPMPPTFVRSADPADATVAGRFAASLDSLLAAHPYPDTTRFQSDRVNAAGGLSLHLVQTRVPVPPHFHLRHDETVVVLRGHGIFYAGSADAKDRRATLIGPGAVIQIPRGTVHAVNVTGTETLVAYSIFTPQFDATDRHPAPGWLEKSGK